MQRIKRIQTFILYGAHPVVKETFSPAFTEQWILGYAFDKHFCLYYGNFCRTSICYLIRNTIFKSILFNWFVRKFIIYLTRRLKYFTAVVTNKRLNTVFINYIVVRFRCMESFDINIKVILRSTLEILILANIFKLNATKLFWSIIFTLIEFIFRSAICIPFTN